jgi:hypothetical protein
MSKLQGGRAADGEAALKAFATDPREIKAFRAEATYHLASHALAEGKQDDLKTYAEQLTQLDPMSPWTQRVMAMRAQVSVGTTPPPTDQPTAPAIKLPGIGK